MIDVQVLVTHAASVATMEREMGHPTQIIHTPDVCYLFQPHDYERLPGVVDRWETYGITAHVVLIPPDAEPPTCQGGLPRWYEHVCGMPGVVHTKTRWKRRIPPMTIAKVLAVYKTSPIVLVVESAESMVFELSLPDLRGGGHRFSEGAWTSLVEEYRMFACQLAPG